MKILLIGAGQIGSRHLQGLALLNNGAKIDIVDPSKESLATAKQRYEDVKNDSSPIDLNFYTSLTDLDKNTAYDFAIIATDARIRKGVTVNLLSTLAIKKIIFEKVLFQKKTDYLEIDQLLKKHQVKAWVNCPMREWPGYKTLKKQIAQHESKPTSYKMTVTGGDWGLACNSIHYVDLFTHLTGLTPTAFSTDFLETEIRASKRAGFYELTGELNVMFADQSKVTLFCDFNSTKPVQLTIETGQQRHIIKEDLKCCYSSYASSNWKFEKWDLEMPYQSQLTGLILNELTQTGRTDLPTYQESMNIHLPMIESFTEFFKIHLKTDTKGDLSCPIT
ncbi:MAG: Gfo/Idh/MocA family oxidoreductase [Bdellovibrionota bacterium]